MIHCRPVYRVLCRRPAVSSLRRDNSLLYHVAQYSTPALTQQTQSTVPNAASLQVAFLEKKQDPVETFRTCARDNVLTKEVVFVCLQHIDASNKLKANAGSIALEWFWKNRNIYVEPDDNTLLYLITRLMVREGREGSLWHWINQRTGKPNDARSFARVKWRGLFLKGIIKTRAELSENGSLDYAIQTYFRAKDRNIGIPLYPGYAYLYTQLARPRPVREWGDDTTPKSGDELVWKGRFPNTNLDLWSRFYEEAERGLVEAPNKKLRVKMKKHRQASLMLNHPQFPDPEPMLRVFQDIDSDPEHPWLEIESPGAFRSQARQTQDLFLKMDQPREAAWVAKFIEKRLSRQLVWKKEKPLSVDASAEQSTPASDTPVPGTRSLPPLPPMP